MSVIPVSFVVPIGNEAVYNACFKASPLFLDSGSLEVIPQIGYASAAEAFNSALDKASNDIVVIAHQDILLPAGWLEKFMEKLNEITKDGCKVGVVGCIGMTKNNEVAGHFFRHDREMFPDARLPAVVRTLDECLISFRKSSGLRFDENLSSFFCYAVDICLSAESRGLQNFAIDAPCFHLSKTRNYLPNSFFIGEEYLLRKWARLLPVQTLSGIFTSRASLRIRKIRNLGRKLMSGLGYKFRHWSEELPKLSQERLIIERDGPVRSAKTSNDQCL